MARKRPQPTNSVTDDLMLEVQIGEGQPTVLLRHVYPDNAALSNYCPGELPELAPALRDVLDRVAGVRCLIGWRQMVALTREQSVFTLHHPIALDAKPLGWPSTWRVPALA